jgi:hypothetical protein
VVGFRPDTAHITLAGGDPVAIAPLFSEFVESALV